MIKKSGRPLAIDHDSISPVARLILERCDELGWTIADLAARLGTHPGCVSRALRRDSSLFGAMITALGGLHHERRGSQLVAVWGKAA